MLNSDIEEARKILSKVLSIIDYAEIMSKLPDCNTCGVKKCKYKPKLGQMTRINCPFWENKENKQ